MRVRMATGGLVRAATALLLALGSAQAAWADDLFDGVAERKFADMAPLPPGSVVNGYPLFEGEGRWRILSARAGKPSKLGVVYGRVTLAELAGEDFAAVMWVDVNLNQVPIDFYMTNDPCQGEHLYNRNTISSMGAQDGSSGNCVTVNAQKLKWRGQEVTALNVEVTNSRTGSRYYGLDLYLNPALLGFPGTSVDDWQAAARDADPARKAFFARVVTWAQSLQDGVARAIAYSKPRDAFALVPPWSSLAHPKGAVVARIAPATAGIPSTP